MYEEPKLAVVMMSLGDRPWARNAFGTFEVYASRYGIDAFFIATDDAADLRYTEPIGASGRPNKRAYALKSYYAWRFLSHYGYDKVLMVDDTCVIHPESPNIFAEQPTAEVVFTTTSRHHAERSHRHIMSTSLAGDVPPTVAQNRYANSGVVIYDKRALHAFAPDQIVGAGELLTAKYPHQTLLYYLVEKHALEVGLIPKKWNRLPGLDLPRVSRSVLRSAREYVDVENNYLMHFTGGYKYRGELVEDLAEYYSHTWP